MKKFLSSLLLLGVCFISLPLMAESFTDNDGVTWTYNYGTYSSVKGLELTGIQGNSSTVVVPDSLPYNGKQEPVIRIAQSSNLFEYNTVITSVTLPNTIKQINSYAFRYASNLVSVNIPSSVVSIGSYAFYNCSSLASITIPSSVTSLNNTIFAECSSLKSAVVKANVTSLPAEFFCNSPSLESVELPETLQSLGNRVFEGCKSLKTIPLPASLTSIGENAFKASGLQHIDCSNVVSIGNKAFQECSQLSQVTLRDVQTIGNYAFQSCAKLASVTIPTTATSIGNYAFSKCSALSEVVIPASVITMGVRAFEQCTSLTAVSLPITFIGESAFEGCSALQSVEIGANLKTIGTNAFLNCSNLTTFTTASDNANYSAQEGVLFNKNKTQIVLFPVGKSGDYTIPNTITAIGEKVFANCTKLTGITIPATVNSIGAYAFQNCTGLTSLKLPSIEVINDYTFSGCSSLREMTIPTSVTGIGNYAFQNCMAFEEIVVPSSVTELGNAAFVGCNLIHLKSTTPATLQSTSLISANAFAIVPDAALTAYREAEQWSSFASQIVPENSYSADVTIEAEAKASALHKKVGEANLENVVSLKITGTMNSYDMMIIRNKMTRLRNLDLSDASIEANSYEYYQGNCSHKDSLIGISFSNLNLASVKLPRTLKYMETAFQNCTNLSSVEMYDNLEAIGPSSFYGCSALHSIVLPQSLQSIGTEAFRGAGLLDIEIPTNVTYLGVRAFAGKDQSSSYSSRYSYNSTYTESFSEGNRYVTFYSYSGGSLQSVRFASDSKLKEISDYAFAGNANLKSVTFGQDSLQSIMFGAFSKCGLESVVLPSTVLWLGAIAFRGCSNLKQVELSENIETLTGGVFLECSSLNFVIFKSGHKQILPFAFASCTNLKSVNLPASVKEIKDYAFLSCSNMDTIRIASSVEKIGTQAFNGCPNVSRIYTYTVLPTSIDQQTFSCWHTADLYVPKTSYYNYYYETQWSQFLKLVEFEEDFDYFYVPKDGDYELGGETGTIEGNPDVNINEGGGLIVGGDTSTTQGVGDITINVDDDNAGSIIANCNLDAKNLKINITIGANKWYFFCFPYDIPRELVQLTKGQGVWYEYHGNIRAEQGHGGWKKVEDKKLHKGKGYIFQASVNADLVLTIENPEFGCEDVKILLETYGAKLDNDASWNFVGNPFPSYFDINKLFEAGFSSPITIWNRYNQTYETVRPGDDIDYSFAPFEGFFVQKPDAETAFIEFPLDGRETQKQSEERNGNGNGKKAPSLNTVNSARSLINLELSNGKTVDRTRIVINDKAKLDYELGSDAAKFLSTEAVPQLYSIEQGAQYSINERPAAEGNIALGFIAPEDGQYTLRATRMDKEVIIYDNEMQVEVNLKDDDYTFFSKAGVDNTRFAICRVGEAQAPTSLESIITSKNGPVDIYTISGVLIKANVTDSNINLPGGAYILKSNNSVEKVILR